METLQKIKMLLGDVNMTDEQLLDEMSLMIDLQACYDEQVVEHEEEVKVLNNKVEELSRRLEGCKITLEVERDLKLQYADEVKVLKNKIKQLEERLEPFNRKNKTIHTDNYKIIQLRQMGFSIRMIGELLSIGRGTIDNRLKAIISESPRMFNGIETHKTMLDTKECIKNNLDILHALGISQDIIQEILRR